MVNGSQGRRPAAGTVRRNTGAGAQNLALLAQLAGTEDAGVNSGATGAALPSMANNSDFSTDSVAVTGQAGTTNPFAGVDMEQLRQNAELDQSLGGGGQGGPGGGRGQGGGPGRGGPAAVDPEEAEVLAAVEVVLAEAAGAWWRRWRRRWGRRRPAVAVDSAISATSSPISPTALSSGQAETAR